MRMIGRASAAIAGAAVLVLGAVSPVFAGDKADFEYSVSPEAIEPGGEVTIRTTGCRAPTVTVSSGVFGTVTLTEGESKSATIFDDVKPEAEYEITFDCDGVIRSLPLLITSDKPGKSGKPGKSVKSPHSSAPLAPLASPRPERPKERPHEMDEDGAHKGVKAGIGGSTDGGPNTVGLTVGAAVIAVAIGGAVHLVRRRSVNGS